MSHSLQKLSVREKIGYSLGDVATNFFFQSMILYQNRFYTDTVGLSPATVGWMFLVMALFNPTPMGWSMITGSPFYGALFITMISGEPRFNGNGASIGCAILWMFVYGGLSMVLLTATLSTFNRCLGRVEGVFASFVRVRPRPVVLVRVPSVVREPSEVV